MRPCTVCKHTAREEIDRALVGNASYRSVAKQFDISEPATFRHRQHLPATLVKAHEAEEVAQADSVIDEVQAIAAKARTLTAKAEEAGDLRTALMGLREIARILELKARVGGEICAAAVNIDISALPIDQLSEEQFDELDRRLAARRLDRIPKEEQASICERIEKVQIDRMLDDPEKRELLRTRLAEFDAARKPAGLPEN
jgi:transposase-like protein